MKTNAKPITIALSLLISASALMPAAGAPSQRLPDLTPWEGSLKNNYVEQIDGRRLLRFGAGMVNEGDGPMILGGRSKRRSGRIPAFQEILVRGSSRKQKHRVGQFTYQPSKRKWDVLTMAEYRLLDESGNRVIANTKISFCVVDVVLARPGMQGAPYSGQFRSCPAGARRTKIRVGLSIGWADVYSESREGQWIDITNIPPGRYILEMELNPTGAIREKSRGNNKLSVPVTL